jgi:hypothetical protein
MSIFFFPQSKFSYLHFCTEVVDALLQTRISSFKHVKKMLTEYFSLVITDTAHKNITNINALTIVTSPNRFLFL